MIRDTHLDEDVDLLMLERLLRPLRCLAESHAQGRVIDDVCMMQKRDAAYDEIESVKGFSAAEIMQGFGGESQLEASCNGCPANVFQVSSTSPKRTSPKRTSEKAEESASDLREWKNDDSLDSVRQFAGCYGYLMSHYADFDLFEFLMQCLKSVREASVSDTIATPSSTLSLNLLWRNDLLENSDCLSLVQLQLFECLFDRAFHLHESENRLRSESVQADLISFARAVRQALAGEYSIRVRVVPEGRITGRTWWIPQHCSNCIESIEKWNGQCPTCKTSAPPNSLRKRNLRGDRPYWPIFKFLGQEKALELANRFYDRTEGGPLTN